MILFSFVGGHGHFLPLVPFARAAAAAGHEIGFVTPTSMAHAVRAAGFAAGSDGAAPTARPDRQPLLAVDREREERDLRERFAREGARLSAARVIARCATTRPDLIVCDEVDFGAMIAAERLGIPHATVVTCIAGGFIRPDVVAAALDEVRAEHGLPPDPELAVPGRYLVLASLPPTFRDPAFALPPTAHHVRPVTPVAADGSRVVYFTLGTVFNIESGDLFGRVLAGLRELPVDLVVTVGRQIEPAEFGPQPPNVHIEQFVPQERILPRCEVMVSHGGSGSVLGALAHGVPMVLIPMGADQPWNGDRCEALGVGRVLDPVASTPADVTSTVSTVLGDPGYRLAAARLRDELAALPDPATAVPLLEKLISI